ncbi:hypothetical protein ILUMI_00951 [Ignelater luminosus]|uniref:PiggyBac transposable element-derived protein domain-containing protein n=1 Tax=Ignelater luminosus TaxID=2038154 RepID=A0A8K0DKZ6_IGNLU|nr:hypothetical protein ILUMI_00951 [Ignelater luminosus]
MSRKPFKTLEEALDCCFSDEIEADIALIPPEVDNLTDEDEGPDDEIAVPDILDVPRTVEVLEQDDISDEVEQPEASTSAGGKKRKRKAAKLQTNWKRSLPQYSFVQSGEVHIANLKNVERFVGGFEEKRILGNGRILNAPLLPPKEIEKRNRGLHNYVFDGENEVLLVRWNDKWNKNEKAKTPITQLAVINRYNRFMGGVDQHDWLLEKHHIPIRGKKWYWCLITRIIDMAIVNACQLYRKVEQKPLNLKKFRRAIAIPYLKLGHRSRVAKGRLISTPSTSRIHVPGDVRFDGKNHLIKKREQRCQYSNYKGRPLTYCSKCLVTLCTACFPLYHTP